MPDTTDLITSGMRRQLSRYHDAIASGMPRVGWKIGVNDAGARERMGLPAPVVGWLNGHRVLAAGEDYRAPAGSRPRLEAEIALRMAADVSARASPAEAAAAVAAVAPAFEFVDATKPLVPTDEMLADDILHEAVLFGSEAAPDLVPRLHALGLPRVAVNGAHRASAIAQRVPDDLGEIVVLVTQTLARHGESLRAGDRIICGSYIDPFDLSAGEEIEADFGPLGRLRVRVAG